ncbi:type II toxin-antitoxin system RelE/ParE family toxin [Microcoleus sp. w2-18bC1]|uniref:type II toxin-antitoxin system RelE/ParE family toxin n=1 Tax=unclassified Microcoleus TaxID=2642155 RepID=UPI002FCEF225
MAQQDELGADLQMVRLLDRFSMLAQFPNMGRGRNELLTGLRSFPVKPYIIFYIILPERVEIVRVLHQSRDIEGQF